MKNLLRAFLILPLGLLLMAQVGMAQNALSPVLPAPVSTQVGGQLVYFFEIGAARGGNFISFLTITNVSLTNYVAVHYQFYNSSCAEVFDYVDVLTPNQRHIINPTAIFNAVNPFLPGSTPTLRGALAPGRYFMTATPVNPQTDPFNLTAVAHNALTGQIWVSDIGSGGTYMTNAVARMAVDVNGGAVSSVGLALPSPYRDYSLGTFFTVGPSVLGYGVAPFYGFQLFRPTVLVVNSFFRPADVLPATATNPFGNRLTFVAIGDVYNDTITNWYKITSASVSLQGFVFDILERPQSIPPRTIACVSEFTISPLPTSLAANQFTDIAGSSIAQHVSNGGWVRLSIGALASNANLFGWWSQYLGPYGGGDYLVGLGRQPQTGTTITTSIPNTVGVPAGIYNYTSWTSQSPAIP